MAVGNKGEMEATMQSDGCYPDLESSWKGAIHSQKLRKSKETALRNLDFSYWDLSVGWNNFLSKPFNQFTDDTRV